MKKYFVSMILVILVARVLGTNNVALAKSAYQSGYEHGIHDAKILEIGTYFNLARVLNFIQKSL